MGRGRDTVTVVEGGVGEDCVGGWVCGVEGNGE